MPPTPWVRYWLTSGSSMSRLQIAEKGFSSLLTFTQIFYIYNLQAKNRPNDKGTVSWTKHVDIDLYDQRIRLGPGRRVQIGILQRGDTTLAVRFVTFLYLRVIVATFSKM